MKRLIIAEKPSVARAIAQELGIENSKEKGQIVCHNDTVVTWCIGHMIQQAEAEAQAAAYAQAQAQAQADLLASMSPEVRALYEAYMAAQEAAMHPVDEADAAAKAEACSKAYNAYVAAADGTSV